MFPQKMTNEWSVEEAQSATGMGVAICRSITEAHHGRILVGQDTQLGGALFTVQLPLASTP